MKSHRKVLTVHTKTRLAFVNLTPEVEAAVRESGVREGLVLVNPMHITASRHLRGGRRQPDRRLLHRRRGRRLRFG
jgi:thiamine phosphate synthase YjbQ (UPF0047 family)